MKGTREDRTAPEAGGADDEGLRRLVALTRATLSGDATRDLWPADENGLRRLGRTRSTGVRLRWPAVSVLGLAALLLVAAPAAWMAARRPRPLTFEVVDGTVGATGEIRPAQAGTQIRFSDGSQIALGREARAQVGDLTADGGTVVLSNGRASTYFVPRAHTRWQVVAGPYVVHVTGTIFDVRWSEEDQAFDVWLKKGSVRVSGPLIGDGIVMTHGQHLLTRVKDSRVSLQDQLDESASGPDERPPAPAPAVDDQPPAEAAPAPAGAAGVELAPDRAAARGAVRPPPDPKAWGKRLARGDFDAVVAAAERRGIGTVLNHGTRGELSALADAARYTRRTALAARTLTAERERFPDSAEGREAGFFLGTLAEDRGDHRAAVGWYARYLRGEGAETYAAQALGRKMLLERDGSLSAARADARDYLGRFASGSYADAARLILKQ